MSCLQSFSDFGLRSLGIGSRALPGTDMTLCDQIALIVGGLAWNIYFLIASLAIGFLLAVLLAVGKASGTPIFAWPATFIVFLFRGSPLFIQFFFAYELFVMLPRVSGDISLGAFELTIETSWLTKAWLGALIVLILNTAAYTAEIFYGALAAIPKGDREAAVSLGFSRWQTFRRVLWPTMLRLAWPAYTNEGIFLFHATTLVFFSGFPAWRQEGDALYYANYIAEKTFNPFLAYPIAALTFVMVTLLVILCFRIVEKRLNQHVSLAR